MSATKENIQSKAVWVMLALTLLFFVLLFRVAYIQLLQGDYYKNISSQRTLKIDTVFGNRGNIYATDGNLLATTVAKYTIRLDLVTIDNTLFRENVKALSDSLGLMFHKPASHFLLKLKKAKRNHNRYWLLARDLGYIDYARLKTFPIFNQGPYKGGVITEQRNVRARPLGGMAVRTVGYFYEGKAPVGIEGAYIDYIKEHHGWRKMQKIAQGQWKPVNDNNEEEPVDGKDVITTLDVNIQDVAHHALLEQLEKYQADHGCVVVMETRTGEVKAIANLGRSENGTYFEKRNYAIYEAHEPGSTFKVASLLVALEDKVADTSDVVDTGNGRLTIHGRSVVDSHQGGFGTINLAKAIELSSNVGIVKMVMKSYKDQPEKFVNKINELGFGKKIGLPIKGEGEPFIPDPHYYKMGDVRSWSGLSLPWMSWGYGVKITPLQMLMFYNAIANNGVMMKPRFIKALRNQGKVEKEFSPIVVNEKIASQETIDKLRVILENVVKRGTAKEIYTPSFSMAGKTGTCQTEYWTGDTKYVSSFAGFFPVKNPKYSCIVVVHKPDKSKGYYGAQVAAPVFKSIAQKIYVNAIQQRFVYNQKPNLAVLKVAKGKYQAMRTKHITVTPNVKGMPVMDAIALLENKGFKVVAKVKYLVKEQSIHPGDHFTKGQTITLS